MSRCAIDDCPEPATGEPPLCSHHSALVPAVIRDTIAEARRLRCPLSTAGYSTVAVAVAKAASKGVRTGAGSAG